MITYTYTYMLNYIYIYIYTYMAVGLVTHRNAKPTTTRRIGFRR